MIILSIEKGREHLKKYGADHRVMEFEVSSATVELAAKALNTEGKRIAKTLSFLLDSGAILIVAARDAKIDNKKYKQTFSQKAKMLTYEQVEEMIAGYDVFTSFVGGSYITLADEGGDKRIGDTGQSAENGDDHQELNQCEPFFKLMGESCFHTHLVYHIRPFLCKQNQRFFPTVTTIP